jgi:hypothetical protein
MALHNADLILLVGQAGADPAPRSWERQAFDEANAPVARRALVLWHEQHGETLSGTAAWLAPRKLDFHLHVRSGLQGDLDRLARIIAGRAVGLVLGAARVCAPRHRPLESGTPVDWLGGASIGAVGGWHGD